MIKFAGIVIATSLVLSTIASAAIHTGRFAGGDTPGYDGPGECLLCHPGKDEDVLNSVHYQLRSANADVGYPGAGLHGMVDRACGLRGTNALVNYDFSCGQCHIASFLPFPDPSTGLPSAVQKSQIDCLICHAQTYDMNNDGTGEALELATSRVRVSDASLGGMEIWYQDRSLEAAESVGQPFTADQCLRCHEHGMASYEFKRGTPFSPETDVHAAAGMVCIDCHVPVDHKIPRGRMVTDMFANDLPDVEVSCEKCHTLTPHTNSIYNDHTDSLSCETCHITLTAGVSRRAWAPTYGITQRPESQVPTYNPQTGRYEYYEEVTDALAPPVYRWFNGQSSMLAEPVVSASAYDWIIPDPNTQDAKIKPFRGIVNGMVFDKRGIPMDPDFDSQFTMLAALEAQQDFMIQMGFMRPGGLNDAERAFLASFPNMLMFDMQYYFDTGDIAAAINLGQGKLAAMAAGQMNLSATEVMALGAQTWSGEYAGLDMPDNVNDPLYVNDMDPRTVTGSFITLSHAVTKENALQCVDCHKNNSRMDFSGALLYDASQAQSLETMLGDVPEIKLGADKTVDDEDLLKIINHWHGSRNDLIKALAE